MTTLIFFAIISMIALLIQMNIVWAIFNMRNHIEKQYLIDRTKVQLLSRIAKNTGSDKKEIDEFIEELNGKLNKK